MAKPEVPAGPISFDGEPPVIRLGALRSQLRNLGFSSLLTEIEQALAQEDWPTATRLLALISEEIGRANNAAVKLISKINRRRWSPLLEPLADEAEQP